MKKHAFTLIELLIVIGIIAVLAAILLPAVNGALQKADQTKAKAQITTLVNAIKQFESTYGYLPTKYYDSSNEKQDLLSSKEELDEYEKLIRILQNEEESTSKINTKGIKFLDIQANTPGEYKDPWDNDFTVYIDSNGDGKINDFDDESAGPDEKFPTTMYFDIIVFSDGARQGDSTAKDMKDNVYSFPANWDGKAKKFVVGK